MKERSVEKREFGHNVTLRCLWVRHAQKASGEVLSGSGGISASGISEKGRNDAVLRGSQLVQSADGAKTYGSTADRTRQTAAALIEGYGVTERKHRVRQERSGDFYPADFMSAYGQLFSRNKQRLMQEYFPGMEFSALSPDDQERIAEAAEEPIVQDWLENPNSTLAELFPPQQAAAHFAPIFAQRMQMAGRLRSGSQVDLLHVTHKTITEAFLISGVLIGEAGPVTSLEQLGGSLRTLDQWDSITQIDNRGRSTTTVLFRGQEYRVNEDILEELLNI